MDVVLIGVQSSGKRTPVKLTRPRTVIGRQTDCHLRIPVNEVSRNHCQVVVENGTVEVVDMGSRNGIAVNGVAVKSSKLVAGDAFTVGPAVFVVQIDGEPQEFDAAGIYATAQAGQRPGSAKQGTVARGDNEMPTVGGGGLLDDITSVGGDPDDSSVIEFEFDLDDDEDDQPPL
ncbi:MAG: FHA domain-containing protein [Planctomycetota bacterium]